MKTREDYARALTAIGDVIRRWDPYDLIAGGAPGDELDAEIARLATHIRSIRTADDAVSAVSAVFSSAFDPEDFTTRKCSQVGKDLFERLIQEGLVEPQN